MSLKLHFMSRSEYVLALGLMITGFLTGCASANKTSGREGITGQVRWYEGNLMPTVGDPGYAERARGMPVKRTLYFYHAVKGDEVVKATGSAKFYTKINAPLVKKAKTSGDGTFRVALPPGRYSVLVMENGRFYAAFFDGEGRLAPIAVREGAFT